MHISAGAKVCGVMAYPVEHSLSPLMHNFFAQELGIDFAYVPLKVRPEDVESAVRGAWAVNLAGMNVTVPHKQAVIPFVRELDPGAKAIGAVNTLVRAEGGYKGYNTDAPGLLRAMKDEGMDIEGQDWLIIGAGGAAKAAAFVLGSGHAGSVIVLNRSRDRAAALAREFNEHFGRDFIRAMSLEEYKALPHGKRQAVQTTSVGMYPRSDAAPVEDADFYKGITKAIDVIYTPARTKFSAMVEAAGGQAAGGLSMLLYQGAAAFELWNPGVTVPKEVIEKAGQLMRKALKGQGEDK